MFVCDVSYSLYGVYDMQYSHIGMMDVLLTSYYTYMCMLYSYARGYMAVWDFFLNMISGMASGALYLSIVGNHEVDAPHSRSYYNGYVYACQGYVYIYVKFN